MYKLLFYVSLFYFVNGDLQLEGTWTNLVVYPNSVYIPYCESVTYINEHETAECRCDNDNYQFPIFRRIMKSFYLSSLGGTTSRVNDTHMVHLSHDLDDVNKFLNLDCECDFISLYPLVVYKFLEDGYVVEYMNLHSDTYTAADPNTAHLLARVLPSKEELARVMGTTELKNRAPGLMCENLK